MVVAIGMNLGTIKTRIKRQFGDTASVQITDPDIVDWVNASLRELVRMNNLNKQRATAVTVSGTTKYTLPEGIVALGTVKYKGMTLAQLSQEEADAFVPSYDDLTTVPVGTPTHYWLYDNSIFIYPAPDTAGAQLLLYYTVQPTPVAVDADIPSVPTEYHNRILEYCLAQAYELDGNTELYMVKMNQFSQGRTELLGNDIESESPFYESITSLPSDSGDYMMYSEG